ncbi:hypothetical protein [Micromonospora sp. NPDC093244]|uniref:hypothetical protein n=1 Tax=Micromonospora sp. NPDC093244 TaxID=3155071 RepID=UPI003443716E
MAVGAQQTEIARSVVEKIAVDVVDMQRQLGPLPCRPGAAHLAVLGKADCCQGTFESKAWDPTGVGGQHHQQVFGGFAPPTYASVVRLPGEVRRVDAESLELTADVGV